MTRIRHPDFRGQKVWYQGWKLYDERGRVVGAWDPDAKVFVGAKEENGELIITDSPDVGKGGKNEESKRPSDPAESDASAKEGKKSKKSEKADTESIFSSGHSNADSDRG